MKSRTDGIPVIVEIENRAFVPNIVWRVPCVAVEDAPRYKQLFGLLTIPQAQTKTA